MDEGKGVVQGQWRTLLVKWEMKARMQAPEKPESLSSVPTMQIFAKVISTA